MSRPRGEAEPPADVAEVHHRISEWRRTRRKRGRMPEALWHAATSLVPRHGVHRTAKWLGLCYDSLKKRSQADTAVFQPTDEAMGGFVELPSIGLEGLKAVTTVELLHPSGMRIVVRVPPDAPLDVVALAKAVCGLAR